MFRFNSKFQFACILVPAFVHVQPRPRSLFLYLHLLHLFRCNCLLYASPEFCSFSSFGSPSSSGSSPISGSTALLFADGPLLESSVVHVIDVVHVLVKSVHILVSVNTFPVATCICVLGNWC